MNKLITINCNSCQNYNILSGDQEPNETIDAYVAMLRTLARTCKYEALEEEMIRDRIVLGIRDNSTRKKLSVISCISFTTYTIAYHSIKIS